ncbi:hypothetical protein PFNF135_00397 [Plasmodium falciparum NF135/5.C10]|uniref:Surface antigen n=1 Tax=Plasmodium falciparum NF135/5.C10 TaxID=1036726 RepID=W4IP85_PLAFA|nr:hypothetical protein PFNF135_00397 [Plasmodium falciparum NF135/5.C10]
MVDKVEKGCLRCAQNLGGIVAPSSGVLAGIAEGALYAWKPKALEVAITAALNANAVKIAAAANAASAAEIIKLIKLTLLVPNIAGQPFETFFTATPYKNVANITQVVYSEFAQKCITRSSGSLRLLFSDANRHIPICQSVWNQAPAVSRTGEHISDIDFIHRTVQNIFTKAEKPANAAAKIAEAAEIAKIKAAEEKTIEAASTQLYGAIGYSILAILIIVLIMLIIYLILRYRRKKKMKKKLQYIKLLEE